jgi:hypothetical protein
MLLCGIIYMSQDYRAAPPYSMVLPQYDRRAALRPYPIISPQIHAKPKRSALFVSKIFTVEVVRFW